MINAGSPLRNNQFNNRDSTFPFSPAHYFCPGSGSRQPLFIMRVCIIAIDGASCSGKTTLAKHLNQILPNSIIFHQDDFAPAQELIPIHPVYGVQDWDDAEGA